MPPHSQQGLLLVLRQERAALRRFLVARMGSASDADDLFSELWIKVTESASGPVENPKAYLFRMASNLISDRVRETRRRAQRESDWINEQHGFVSASAEVFDADPSAEQKLIEQDEVQRLFDAIANLPSQAQRVLRMHKLEGLSHGEIAARLGISKSAVEKHIAVAMNHLRKTLRG